VTDLRATNDVAHGDVEPPAVVRVLAAVIARGDRYLVCQRPAHKRHGGLWEFPGGKLEAGEHDADAARRELHEELGVAVVDVGGPSLVVHDEGSPYHIAFVPVRIAGEPACLEHSALAWATLAELTTYALAPSDRRYVEWAMAAPQR
jgi:8-oxo-dGTP diphosphatase